VFVSVKRFGYVCMLRDVVCRRWSQGEYCVRVRRGYPTPSTHAAYAGRYGAAVDGALAHAPQRAGVQWPLRRKACWLFLTAHGRLAPLAASARATWCLFSGPAAEGQKTTLLGHWRLAALLQSICSEREGLGPLEPEPSVDGRMRGGCPCAGLTAYSGTQGQHPPVFQRMVVAAADRSYYVRVTRPMSAGVEDRTRTMRE
jgi:hypothetical protein